MSAQEIVDSRFGAVAVERVDDGRTLRVSGEAIPAGSIAQTGGVRHDNDSVELGVSPPVGSQSRPTDRYEPYDDSTEEPTAIAAIRVFCLRRIRHRYRPNTVDRMRIRCHRSSLLSHARRLERQVRIKF